MHVCGAPVGRSFIAVAQGAFGSWSCWVDTLVKATPLVLIGLGMAVAMRGGVWNVGGDGQFLMGCLGAGLAGLALPGDVSRWGSLAVLAAGFAGGALWAAGPGVLRARLGANEIIVTVMLNYVAAYTILFLIQGPMKDGYLPQSAALPLGAQLPMVAEGGRLHIGTLMALGTAVIAAVVLHTSTAGFELRAVGLDERAAHAAGLRVRLAHTLAFAVSGGLAGLAGAVELSAVYTRLRDGMSPGYGFLGLAVAILAKARPMAVVPMGVLFAGLLVGGGAAERAVGTPKEVIYIFQGVFLLAFAAIEGRLTRGGPP